jgi:hypothetical protein
MLVLADGDAREALAAKPPLDREATSVLAATLFPGEGLHPIGDGELIFTSPPEDEVHIGCFPGVTVIAAIEFALDLPSTLPQRFIAAGDDRTVILHAMHSAVDWFAYAIWRKGELIRSLSLAPDSGIMEDLGERLAFELPYWEGEHALDEAEDEQNPYPLPFHPLELGNEALVHLFGYQIEGLIDHALLDAMTVPLVRYRRVPPAS